MTAKLVLDVQIKRLHPQAIIPQYQTAGAAGFDLHAVIPPEYKAGGDGEPGSLVINPGESLRISTGIAVSINDPSWGLFLFSRSGLGSKGLRLANGVGVIDSDYQGELFVAMRNDSDRPFVVTHGDRIAQGVFMPVLQARFNEVADFDHTTERGTAGFGSTGK